MRQAVMMAPGKIELRKVAEPVPGPGEVLLRVRRIGICGSDIHVYHGRHPFTRYPVIQGHEFSAEVASVGEGVEAVKPGMKVTALPQIVCGRCAPCLRGDYHICDNLKVRGFQAPGAAQDLFVTDADKVVPLPGALSFDQGAMIEPLSVAVHAVSRAGSLQNRNVVVLGAGPIGNLVAQVAMCEGAHVLITELSDFRLDIARRCGLTCTSNAAREGPGEARKRVFGEDGFDVAFDCAGTTETITAAVETIEKGGTIVVVGVFYRRAPIKMGFIQDRELQIAGSMMYRYEDYERAIELVTDGKISTEPLESSHFPLEEFATAYEFIDRHRDKSMKVFIDL